MKNKVIFKNLNEGKCYISLRVEPEIEPIVQSRFEIHERIEKSFILEIIPAKFKKVEKIYGCSELKSKLNIEKYLLHPTKKSHNKFSINNKGSLYSLGMDNFHGFNLCYYRTITKTKLFTEKDLVGDSMKVKEEMLISDSEIIKYYVKNKPKELKDNQYYFEGGKWTALEEIDDRSGSRYTVREIKMKLIKLGYELAEDNIMSDRTKEALLDFQKKNELPEGQLDFKTLKKLGVRY